MNRDKLNLILQLLNRIEVKGEPNLNDLLAVIQLTKQLIAEVNNNGMDSNRGACSSSGAVPNNRQTHSTAHSTNVEDTRPVEQSSI